MDGMSEPTCPVCVGVMKHRMACPACDFAVCHTCQKEYSQPQCMSCRLPYTRRYMLDSLGRTFVDTTMRRFHEAELLARERVLLPSTQPLVDRMRHEQANADSARFAMRAPDAVARPASVDHRPGARTLPCPASGCAGFVRTGEDACGVCNVTVCRKCGIVKQAPDAAGHECDGGDVASTSMLEGDSRPCPKCWVLIFRISGCDHMICTRCRARFSWQTGKAMHANTNEHYGTDEAVAAIEVDEDDGDIMLDRVPADASMESHMMTSLYDDVQVVRCTVHTRYTEEDVLRRTSDQLSQLRVRYLLGKVSESKWAMRIYSLDVACKRDVGIARILCMYLAQVRAFQLRCQTPRAARLPDPSDAVPQHDDPSGADEQAWLTCITMCNDMLRDVRYEYGGPCMQLKVDLHDPHAIPLTCV